MTASSQPEIIGHFSEQRIDLLNRFGIGSRFSTKLDADVEPEVVADGGSGDIRDLIRQILDPVRLQERFRHQPALRLRLVGFPRVVIDCSGLWTLKRDVPGPGEVTRP